VQAEIKTPVGAALGGEKNMLEKIKRAIELGPSGMAQSVNRRLKRKLFAAKFKIFKHKSVKLDCRKIDPDFGSTFDFLENTNFYENNLKKNYTFYTNNDYFPKIFYQKIEPADDKKDSFLSNVPDIKKCWEESRFNDIHFSQIPAWVEKNPFLIGVNWVCPMEVAIRAINWIAQFCLFKESTFFDKKFKKLFFNSLYEHAYYLENNWETSDKPNNHYIANLVGYFFLCNFFDSIPCFKKKFFWAKEKIIKQFFHQINEDGTSYEGSTHYHKLVTELFYLFSKLCHAKKIDLPKKFHTRFKRMIVFLHDCTIDGKLIQIGDNDGSKILPGIKWENSKKRNTTHYRDFGLTILKNKNFHITLRHPTYKKKQPNGHFHGDELSITLSYKNIPILVDPGTYLYTANKKWRNLMRSAYAHNTFFETNENKVNYSDIFQFDKEEFYDQAIINENSVQSSFKNRTRTVFLNNRFAVKDSIIIKDTQPPTKNFLWSFLFSPLVDVESTDGHRWKIFYKKKLLLEMSSEIKLKKTIGFYSPTYGVLQKCAKLVGLQTQKCDGVGKKTSSPCTKTFIWFKN
jgi:hypothetical protein